MDVECYRLPAWGYWSFYGIESGSIVYVIENKHGAWWYHSKEDHWYLFDWDKMIGSAFVVPETVTPLEMLVMTGCSIGQLEKVGSAIHKE